MITDFGVLERYFLSSLQNIDEQVILSACQCLQKLLSGKGGTGSSNEGTQELLIKRQGIQILKVCCIDEMIDIRISSLEILAQLCVMRRDVQDILIEIGILEICCNYVKQYPCQLVDQKVLALSLEILSSIFEEKQSQISGLVAGESLKCILNQLKNTLQSHCSSANGSQFQNPFQPSDQQLELSR